MFCVCCLFPLLQQHCHNYHQACCFPNHAILPSLGPSANPALPHLLVERGFQRGQRKWAPRLPGIEGRHACKGRVGSTAPVVIGGVAIQGLWGMCTGGATAAGGVCGWVAAEVQGEETRQR